MNSPLATIQLPAHLQALVNNQALSGLNQAASSGISAGSRPQISIKGSRFRLQDPQGQEIVVPEFFLDVVIVDANPNLSKRYYAGAYDPNKEGSAPDCFSDNGVAPSQRASKPQCGTCSACPHNVWGSKITPAGSQIKACADIKKVAVLLAVNTSGPVWELDIPAASLTNFGAYIRSLDAAGIPAASIMTRLTFDTSADYPKLLFAPIPVADGQSPYITADMMKDVLEVVNSDEVTRCIGKDDRAFDPARLTAGTVTGPVVGVATGGGVPATLANLPPPPMMPNAGHAGSPPLMATSLPPASVPAQQETIVNTAAGPVKRTRTRKPAAPEGVQQAAQGAISNLPPQPAFNLPPPIPSTAAGLATTAPASTRDAQVPLNPTVASASLESLINQVMGGTR